MNNRAIIDKLNKFAAELVLNNKAHIQLRKAYEVSKFFKFSQILTNWFDQNFPLVNHRDRIVDALELALELHKIIWPDKCIDYKQVLSQRSIHKELWKRYYFELLNELKLNCDHFLFITVTQKKPLRLYIANIYFNCALDVAHQASQQAIQYLSLAALFAPEDSNIKEFNKLLYMLYSGEDKQISAKIAKLYVENAELFLPDKNGNNVFIETNNDREMAIKRIKEGMCFDSSNHEARILLAHLLCDNNKFVEAEEVMNSLRMDEPDNAEMKKFHLVIRQRSEAFVAMKNSHSFRPYEDLMCQQDYEKALEFLKTLEDAGHLLAKVKRANIYLVRKQFHKAMILCSEVIFIGREIDEAYAVRGKTLMALNEPRKALADFSLAIALQPLEAAYHVMRARAYWMMHAMDACQADVERAYYLAMKYPQNSTSDISYESEMNMLYQEGYMPPIGRISKQSLFTCPVNQRLKIAIDKPSLILSC